MEGEDGGLWRGSPVPQALAWSIAVVLVGAVLALVVTPSAQGRTTLSQGSSASDTAPRATAGLATPPGPPPSPATGTGPAPSVPTAPASSAAPPGSTAAAAPARKAASQARSTTTAKAAAPAGPAASAPAVRLQPDAGAYPLAISGTSTVDGARASVPSSGSLLVEQRSTTDQAQSATGLPGNLVLLQRATPNGLDLVAFSLSASSKTLTFAPPSPLPFVKTDVPVGTSWSWTARSTDGSVSVSQVATVQSIGPVLVGGLSVPAVRVERILTATGTVQGTLRLTSTVSLVDRLPLIQHQVLDVKATFLGLFSTRIVGDVTATLTSTRPR